MRIPRRLTGLIAVGLAGGLALAACGDDGGNGGDDGDAAAPSLEDCEDSPNDCNSGPRGEGGDVVWMINQGHEGVYNELRAEGNSVYLNQMLEGIYPDVGLFDPSGEWAWNLDLLQEPAELVNEDPMTVVYKIRPEAVWDDGTPVDVEDVIYQWRHQSGKPEHCSDCAPADSTFDSQIASVEGADDGKTVTVTYEEGFINPEWFTKTLYELPAHIATQEFPDWQDDPDAMAESSLHFLNTVPTWSAGPYIVESADAWVPDERVTMVPNDAWYGAEETTPTLDTLTKLIISDQPSWPTALQNEEIHGGAPASFTPDGLEQIEQVPGALTSVGSAGSVWEHVDVNMDSLDDVALRRAIFTAIDREDARTRIYGDLEPPYRNNHLLSDKSEFYEDHLSATGYATGDADAARTILEEAGYTGFESGGTLTDPDGNPVPDVRFAFLQGNENRAQFTELTIDYLAEIGITVIPEATPPEQLGTVLSEQDYDLVIFGWSGSPAFSAAANQFYNSESGSNFGKVNNPDLDDLALQAASQLTLEESATYVNQLVPLVLEEAYSLPLWDTLNFMFVSDQFINIRDNHNDSLRTLYNVGSWGIAQVE